MGFFDFFKSKDSGTPKPEPTVERSLVHEEDFVDNTPPEQETSEEKLKTIVYGLDEPINAIYVYVERNLEAEGEQDAAKNPDISYMNQKVVIIQQGLRRRIDLVRMMYNQKIVEADTSIETYKQFGLLSKIPAIQGRKILYDQHLAKLNELEAKFNADDPYMISMVVSYERGFKTGVTKIIG